MTITPLTEADVAFIRANAKKYSGKKMAKMFGVSDTAIYYILKRKTWKHVA